MRFDYIRFTNYRQYKDEKIIFPKLEKNRNFTIIQGSNGAGKTNILNGISWCLYGEEMHLGTKYKGLPIYNTLAANETKPGKNCDVEVEIQIYDDEEKRIIINRRICFQKLEDGSLRKLPMPLSNSPDGSKLELLRQIGRDMVSINDPEFVINKLIPKSIEGYFFFDGEQLNNYFRTALGENIRDAVFKISQLDLLETVIDHLSKRKNDFLKQANGLSSKAKEIRENMETYSRSLNKYKENLDDLKTQKAEAQMKEEEYSENLRGGPDQDVVKLESESREIENDLEQLEEELESTEEDRYEYLLENTPVLFTYEAIQDVLKMIGEREEAGDIPPDVKRDFVEKLLKQGKCICGTDISKKDKHRKKVEKFLQERKRLSDISVELTILYTTLKTMTEDLGDFQEKVVSYGKRIKRIGDMNKQKSEKLKKIQEIIGKSDVEQIRFWQEKKEEYKKLKNELIEEISRRKNRIEDVEKMIKKLEKDLEKELAKEEKSKKISNILTFANESLKAAEQIKDGIMDDLRKEIEEKTENQFFNLIWKKETYKDVKIDDQYNISVIHQSGLDGIGTLSAGERQVLALSFMAALNSVSGFNIPIIIDTPLGRISKEPKNKIAKNLPNYLKGKQVTLLVIDEEYTPDVRKRLSGRIGAEYRIDYKETINGNMAKVVKYD